jgi:hypothetical protein
VVSWRLLIGRACRARRGAPRRGRGRRRSARWVQGSAARDAGDPRRGRARKVRGGGRRDDLVLDAAGSRVEHGLAAEGGLRVGEQVARALLGDRVERLATRSARPAKQGVARAAGYGLGVAADVQERNVSIEGQERGGRGGRGLPSLLHDPDQDAHHRPNFTPDQSISVEAARAAGTVTAPRRRNWPSFTSVSCAEQAAPQEAGEGASVGQVWPHVDADERGGQRGGAGRDGDSRRDPDRADPKERPGQEPGQGRGEYRQREAGKVRRRRHGLAAGRAAQLGREAPVQDDPLDSDRGQRRRQHKRREARKSGGRIIERSKHPRSHLSCPDAIRRCLGPFRVSGRLARRMDLFPDGRPVQQSRRQ